MAPMQITPTALPDIAILSKHDAGLLTIALTDSDITKLTRNGKYVGNDKLGNSRCIHAWRIAH